jgi:ABC-type lipoprotein export system ATPase subunit
VKRSKLQDIQRAIERRPRDASPFIASLSFQNVPGFADAAIEPNSGFVAICGGTGIGKTALLDLIYYALAPQSQIRSNLRRSRLAQSEVTIRVPYPGGVYENTGRLGNTSTNQMQVDGFPYGVHFVDLLDRTLSIQTFYSDKDILALKEGVSFFNFDKQDVEFISVICKKNYSSIRAYEIEGEDDIIRPFFEVVVDGVSYDTRSMATGELSALYISWIVKFCAAYSIILLEEPESYLPPISHPAIYSLICHAAVQKKLSIIFTTHSAIIANIVSENNIISIRRQSNQSVLPVTKESKIRVLSRLGLKPSGNAIILVEDQLAFDVLSEIIELYNLGVSISIQIMKIPEGSGGIKKALDNIPYGINSFHFLGILDGDMEDEAKKWKCSDRIIFLPFRRVMEEEFLDVVQKYPRRLAKSANRKLERIDDAIENHLGQDCHERFRGLADGIGLSMEALTRIALKQWISGLRKKTAVKTFAQNLSKKLGIEIQTQS